MQLQTEETSFLAIKNSQLLDRETFARRAPAEPATEAPPEEQYLSNPSYWYMPISALFDGGFYSNTCSDLGPLEGAPILHYLEHGYFDGRTPSPLVDMEFILGQLTEGYGELDRKSKKHRAREVLGRYPGLYQLLADTGCSPHPLFSNQYFLETNGLSIGEDLPINFYVRNNGRDPHTGQALETSPYVSWREYLAHHEDLRHPSTQPPSPLEHFIQFGFRENRVPDYFDPQFIRNTSKLTGHDLEHDLTAFLRTMHTSGQILGPRAFTPYTEQSLPSLRSKRNTASRVMVGVVLFDNSEDELVKLKASIDLEQEASPEIETSVRLYVNDPEHLPLYESIFDRRLLLVDGRGNIGFGSAHNRLMEACFLENDLYIGINPDGYLLPGAISATARFNTYHSGNALIELMVRPIEHPKWFDPITLDTFWVSGAAFAISDRIWRATQGFDENFHMYCEDVDLSWRARAQGFSLRVCPKARFFHDVVGRQVFGADPDRERERENRMLRGAYYLARKWNGESLARALKDRLIDRGHVTYGDALDEPDESVPAAISGKICDFENYLVFAPRRFWLD